MTRTPEEPGLRQRNRRLGWLLILLLMLLYVIAVSGILLLN
jgi:predicted nucleic acid-binding Zn ribbon protein